MRIGRRGVALLAAVLATAAFLATLNQLRDWDMFHHLAYGRDILRRGGFAREDPFLFPWAGVPSGPQPSWLGSVAIYLSWRLLGDPGPLVLASSVAAALFVLLLRDGLEGDETLVGLAAALAPLGLALAVYRGRAVPRPEMFANLLLAGTLYALRRYVSGRKMLLLFFPLAAALWANVHQSVLAGIAVVGIFVAVNGVLLLGGRVGRRLAEVSDIRSLAMPLVLAAAGVALAGLASPTGFEPFLSPLRYVAIWAGQGASVSPGESVPAAGEGAGLMKAVVTELQPMDLGWLDPFTWLVALAAASFLAVGVAGRRLDPRELVTAAAFAVLATRAVRFGAMAAIVLAPVVARNLRAGLGRASGRAARVLGWSAPMVAAVVVAVPWWWTLARSSLHFGTGPARQLPVRAGEYLRSAGGAGRPYNTFHFGGYLEWLLDQKVYQDGRGWLRPDEARAAMLGPVSRETFEPVDARYRFDALVVEYPELEPETAAMLAATQPEEDWLADRRRWALVAFDDGGTLYLRRDGALAHLAARDEFRFARPAVPPGVGTRDLAATRADFERSVRVTPGCALCRNALGYLYLREGRVGEAEAMFTVALDGAPLVRAQALYGLAQTAVLRGDRAAAQSRLREVIAVAADPSGPRRQLAVLLSQDGRPREALAEIRKNLRGGRPQPVDREMALGFARQAGDAGELRELEGMPPPDGLR